MIILDTQTDLKKFPELWNCAQFNSSLIQECHFEEKLALCFNSSEPIRRTHSAVLMNEQDAIYVFGWIELIGPIITFPIFSILAFSLNLLVILIIRSKKNKQEKLFESKMFRIMEMNSAFNCIGCLIYQFKLMGICMGPNSIFCSSIRETKFVSWFGTINIYLSETIKSSSVSYTHLTLPTKRIV